MIVKDNKKLLRDGIEEISKSLTRLDKLFVERDRFPCVSNCRNCVLSRMGNCSNIVKGIIDGNLDEETKNRLDERIIFLQARRKELKKATNVDYRDGWII